MHSDNLLVTSNYDNLVSKGFDTAYTLKSDDNGKKWAKPMTYIGSDIKNFQVPDTRETYRSMYGDTYIKDAIKNVEPDISKYVWQSFKTARLPIKP